MKSFISLKTGIQPHFRNFLKSAKKLLSRTASAQDLDALLLNRRGEGGRQIGGRGASRLHLVLGEGQGGGQNQEGEEILHTKLDGAGKRADAAGRNACAMNGLERETGFEPATSTLARSHSTN